MFLFLGVAVDGDCSLEKEFCHEAAIVESDHGSFDRNSSRRAQIRQTICSQVNFFLQMVIIDIHLQCTWAGATPTILPRGPAAWAVCSQIAPPSVPGLIIRVTLQIER